MANIPLQVAADAVGIGRRKIFTQLRAKQVLDGNNHPSSWAADQGLLTTYHTSHRVAVNDAYTTKHNYRPMVTEKGLAWLKANKETLFDVD